MHKWIVEGFFFGILAACEFQTFENASKISALDERALMFFDALKQSNINPVFIMGFQGNGQNNKHESKAIFESIFRGKNKGVQIRNMFLQASCDKEIHVVHQSSMLPSAVCESVETPPFHKDVLLNESEYDESNMGSDEGSSLIGAKDLASLELRPLIMPDVLVDDATALEHLPAPPICLSADKLLSVQGTTSSGGLFAAAPGMGQLVAVETTGAGAFSGQWVVAEPLWMAGEAQPSSLSNAESSVSRTKQAEMDDLQVAQMLDWLPSAAGEAVAAPTFQDTTWGWPEVEEEDGGEQSDEEESLPIERSHPVAAPAAAETDKVDLPALPAPATSTAAATEVADAERNSESTASPQWTAGEAAGPGALVEGWCWAVLAVAGASWLLSGRQRLPRRRAAAPSPPPTKATKAAVTAVAAAKVASGRERRRCVQTPDRERAAVDAAVRAEWSNNPPQPPVPQKLPNSSGNYLGKSDLGGGDDVKCKQEPICGDEGEKGPGWICGWGLSPEAFVCPITGELMRDPVVNAAGHMYERVNIEAWLALHNTDPCTNLELPSKALVPLHTVRAAIQDFLSKAPIAAN